MSIKYLRASLPLLFISTYITASFAKDAQVSEPQFEDVVAHWDKKLGKLIELPREIFEVKVKVKALGYGGGEGQLVWRGPRCSYRINSQEQPEFIVRVATQRSDPRGVIQFYKVESLKDKRLLVVSKAGVFSGGKSVANSKAIDFDANTYATSSFKFKANTPLIAGEYVLSTTTSAGNSGYCIGID